ncbi:hypothetical protein [Curtobacterium sp. Curtsp57]|uniref:hypothetical protein n=1 Tax=Curtobacterium sp. Curtsp57 TaxID=3243047 RepID=UPI0039B489CB
MVGISKKHLVAMNPRNKTLSGVGESFDQLLVRKQSEIGFDAAVVAWDLHPRWNPTAEYCRWQETLDVYRGLAESNVLAASWKSVAKARLEELESREIPAARPGISSLRPGMVQVLCMDRMFESLIIDAGSQALKRALSVDGEQVPRWPNLNKAGRQHDELLNIAIDAVRAIRPKRRAVHRVRQGFLVEKHEWASLILRNMLAVPGDSAALRSHPIPSRLAEVR